MSLLFSLDLAVKLELFKCCMKSPWPWSVSVQT